MSELDDDYPKWTGQPSICNTCQNHQNVKPGEHCMTCGGQDWTPLQA